MNRDIVESVKTRAQVSTLRLSHLHLKLGLDDAVVKLAWEFIPKQGHKEKSGRRIRVRLTEAK